ncbi:MAG: TIGR03067 domain-containing protein [Gemmataceae bacterium]
MESTTQAAVPAALVESVTRAAIGFAAGSAVAAGTGSVAAGVAMKEVAAMYLKKMLFVTSLGVGALVAGGGMWIGVQAALPLVAADEKSDTDRLQGEWKITSAKMGGKNAEDDIVGKPVRFTGEKVMFKLDGTFALGSGKDPKQILLTFAGEPAGRQKFAGIYRFDGAKLVLHIAHPGDERPTDFESKPGTTTMLIVLERVKK